MFKSFFLIIFFLSIELYSIEFKNGDIAFVYNSKNPIDHSLKNFLKSDYSHTLIYHNGNFKSITIDFIGDKGKLDIINSKELLSFDNIIIFRPINLRKNQKKCINQVIETNSRNIVEKKLRFDWFYNKNNRFLFCTEFATEPYRRCTSRYLNKTKIRFPMEKILNKNFFKIIYKKNKTKN